MNIEIDTDGYTADKKFKLVPIEPTTKMNDAGSKVRMQHLDLNHYAEIDEVYRAMLAASPEPPRAEEKP